MFFEFYDLVDWLEYENVMFKLIIFGIDRSSEIWRMLFFKFFRLICIDIFIKM